MEFESFEEDFIKEEDPKEKNSTVKFLGIIIILNFFIVFYIIGVVVICIEKNTNNTIFQLVEDYLKYLNKLAITEKRINHLFKEKNNNKDYFNELIQLQKSIFNISWKQIEDNYPNIKHELDKKISNFLFESDKEIKNNISNILFNIMIKGESIDNYLDNKNIHYIYSNIKRDLLKEELKAILLYSFINLPLQLCYFSKNSTIKNNFLNEVYQQMKLSPNAQIFNNINIEMENYTNKSIYIVLGANQGEEYRRITSKNPDIPYINICNTGIRTQYLQSEINSYLNNNIKEYYIKSEFKNIIIQCTSDEKMSDEVYDNFIKDMNNISNTSTEGDLINTFGKYNFSVETVNSVIEYLKLGVPLEKILIIKLGNKNKTNNINDNIKYNKDNVYILFNVIDQSETIYIGSKDKYKIRRATTEANVKAIYYLMNEYKNFFNKEDYNNIILVSNQGNAERQLEVFNIISNIFKYGIEFNSVIWNKTYEKKLNNKNISDYLTDIVVKSYNLISKSLNEFNKNEYHKNKNISIINKYVEEMDLFIKKNIK